MVARVDLEGRLFAFAEESIGGVDIQAGERDEEHKNRDALMPKTP